MTYEGNVSWVETKDGSFKLVAKANGKWNATNTKDMVKALIEAKATVSQWSLWVDLGPNTPRAEAPVKSTELAALIKGADKVELVLTKRPWPQPKLKISKGEAASKPTGKREI
jgi:hypothetical protein